jgi:leucyl-tRNA synthetase
MSLASGTPHENAVAAFVAGQTGRPVEDRFAGGRQLGVLAGLCGQPVQRREDPIWAANFVLHDVGTGAIMSVPAHDDWDSPRRHLLIRPVIRPVDGEAAANAAQDGAFTDDGILHASGSRRPAGRGARAHGERRRSRVLIENGDLSAQGLGRVAPALLGNADPRRPLRVLRGRPRAHGELRCPPR